MSDGAPSLPRVKWLALKAVAITACPPPRPGRVVSSVPATSPPSATFWRSTDIATKY